MTQGLCSRCGEDENGLDEFNICASCRDQEKNGDDYADELDDIEYFIQRDEHAALKARQYIERKRKC
jgi:hypothetical protein